MFLKISEFKKVMKSALKTAGGLYVGNVNDQYLVYTGYWGVCVEKLYATNKFKAAIMELIGDMPEEDSCYKYYIEDKQLKADLHVDYLNPYEKWREAKDFACSVPLVLTNNYHELSVYQRHSDKDYLTAVREWTDGMLSPAELEVAGERMPGRPSVSPLGSVLYFKSETMLYWVCCVQVEGKTRETVFDRMKDLDFFEDDWLSKDKKDDDSGAEETLPY